MSEQQPLWRDELDTLLGRLVDEELSEAETVRLNEILRTQPEANAQYHAYLDVHEDLETQLAVPDFSALDATTKIVEKPVEPTYIKPLLAMVAMVLIGLFINLLVTQPKPPLSGSKGVVEVSKPIAIIKALSGSLVYTGDRGLMSKDLKEGDSLEGGTIEGMTPDAWFELEFSDGSTVMITGVSMLTFSDEGQRNCALRRAVFLQM